MTAAPLFVQEASTPLRVAILRLIKEAMLYQPGLSQHFTDVKRVDSSEDNPEVTHAYGENRCASCEHTRAEKDGASFNARCARGNG